jgi:hypothetical protein
MRKDNYGIEGAGYLKFEDFVRFLEKNPFVRSIELSNSGEIFLNPDLLKIIEHAYKHNIELTAHNGVNFNRVSDEMLEALVKYKFQHLTFSIDGASQETYSKYRRNGNYETVIGNIKQLNKYKKQYNSNFPILRWQYVLMQNNDFESEIRKAQQTAAGLGAKLVFRYSWDGYISQHKDILQAEGYDMGIGNQQKWYACYQLWHEPQIGFDGKLLGCCVNHRKDFKLNVFEKGLSACLKSETYRDTKKMLFGKGVCEDSPCFNCGVYKNFQETGNYLSKKQIGYKSLPQKIFSLLKKILPSTVKNGIKKIIKKG